MPADKSKPGGCGCSGCSSKTAAAAAASLKAGLGGSAPMNPFQGHDDPKEPHYVSVVHGLRPGGSAIGWGRFLMGGGDLVLGGVTSPGSAGGSGGTGGPPPPPSLDKCETCIDNERANCPGYLQLGIPKICDAEIRTMYALASGAFCARYHDPEVRQSCKVAIWSELFNSYMGTCIQALSSGNHVQGGIDWWKQGFGIAGGINENCFGYDNLDQCCRESVAKTNCESDKGDLPAQCDPEDLEKLQGY